MTENNNRNMHYSEIKRYVLETVEKGRLIKYFQKLNSAVYKTYNIDYFVITVITENGRKHTSRS